MADNVKSIFDDAKFSWALLGRLHVVNWVRDKKLAGQVLGRRTGRLARSVVSESVVLDSRDGFSIGTNVIYGIAWEQGFDVPAYRVIARKKKALKIQTPGGVIFRKSANIPARSEPARPFIAPSIEESMTYLEQTGAQVLTVAFNTAFPNRTIVIGVSKS